MRRLIQSLVFIFLVLFISSTYAQSVFSVTEVTEGGKAFTTKLRKDTSKRGTIHSNYPNVDINSTLEITINKDSINDIISKSLNVTYHIPAEQLKIISEFLKKRKELFKEINQSSNADLDVRKEALSKFAVQMLPILDLLESLPEDNTLKIKADEALSIEGNESYSDFFNVLQEEIDHVKNEYATAVDSSKVYFRLAAFINETPVHLVDFDTYKEGEFFRVPRFATAINAGEKQEFEKYKAIAEQANKDAGEALKEIATKALIQTVDNLKKSVEKRLNEPFLMFQEGLVNVSDVSGNLKLKVQTITEQLNQLNESINAVKLLIDNKDDPDFVSKVKTGIGNLIESITKLENFIEQTIAEIKTVPKSAAAAYTTFKESFLAGKDTLNNIINEGKSFLETDILPQLGITKNIKASLLKLGDEVKKIAPENIPDHTSLNLLTSAQRKDGDRLYLKAVIGKQPPGTDGAVETTIEYFPIGLYQIELHSTIGALILFVDNLSSEYPSKSQFQLAPSYSVLFKYGSRKHTAYNQFFKIGAGVNMSTLDFNNDNNYEIGIAFVMSTFRDYLQVGLGRNMNQDKNYWFLGIKLPFMGLDLTGGAKTNNPGK